MKKSIFLLAFCCLGKLLSAQYVYTIKADSVKITNNCDTAELIIENHTQNVAGFLYNKGKGRTEFRQGLLKLNDSTYLIGEDTLKVKSGYTFNPWLQGGNTFGSTGILGTFDNNHIDFYTNSIKRGRLDSIGRLSLDFAANQPYDAFSLTTGNGTKKWFNIHGENGNSFISMSTNNDDPGALECMRLTAGGQASTIETFAYSDLSVKGYHGLDLYGGFGGGSTKYIRFYPGSSLAASFMSNGNLLLATSTDNGYKLQVNGTGWFGNELRVYHPTFATGGIGGGMRWLADNTFYVFGGPGESLKFGPSNVITSSSPFHAPVFYATTNNYGDNYYVPTGGGRYNTSGFPGNVSYIFHQFTNKLPGSNTGSGSPTLMELNKLVNRGDYDALETGLRIKFTVTGVANYLRALETVNGDVKLNTTSGLTSIGLDSATAATSKLDVNGAQGYNQLRLRKNYTPTSSSDTNGNTGDVSWDDNYFYIKTSAGWKRAALSTF